MVKKHSLELLIAIVVKVRHWKLKIPFGYHVQPAKNNTMLNTTPQPTMSLESQILILNIQLENAKLQIEQQRHLKEEYRRLFHEAQELLKK
jgi:hypothetical protein